MFTTTTEPHPNVNPSVVIKTGMGLRASQERWRLVARAVRILERHVTACAVLDPRPGNVRRAARLEQQLNELIYTLDCETSKLTLDLALHYQKRQAAMKQKARAR